jgi:hypothetical protein
MKKSSQIQSVDASATAVPERVSVAMAEITENMCDTDDSFGVVEPSLVQEPVAPGQPEVQLLAQPWTFDRIV